MPTQAKQADLVDGRGAVHKATDLIQPSWRAADVDVKSMRSDAREFMQTKLQTNPLATAVYAAVVGVGTGLIAGWLLGSKKISKSASSKRNSKSVRERNIL